MLNTIAMVAGLADPYSHPEAPAASTWPGVAIIIIVIFFFGTAAVLGPLARILMQEPIEPINKTFDKLPEPQAQIPPARRNSAA